MKKLVKFAAVAALLTVSSNAMAQYEPEAGDISTEVQFNPFGTNFDMFRLDGIQFKGRYFLTNQDALRLKLGFSTNSTTDITKTTLSDDFDSNKPVYTLNNQEVETNNKTTQFQFALGYERHFMQEGRLDVYAGAEIGYKSTSYSGDITTTIDNDRMTGTTGFTTRTQTTSTRKDVYEKQNTTGAINSHNLFIGLFTGVDFYVYKGLYIGTELGIRFNKAVSQVNPTLTTDFDQTVITTNTTGGTSTVTTATTNWSESSESGQTIGKTVTVTGSTQTETKIEVAANATDRERKSTSFDFYIEPALRLGWKF
jgi:hypothetical protein